MHPHAGGRNVWVAAMSFAQLVSWGSLFYTFSLLMPSIERDLGLGRVEVSGAFSAGLLASGLAGLPVGRWIERGHGRVVMTGGSALAGLLLLAHARVDSVAALYAVWVGLGLAMSAIFYEPAFAIMIRRWPADFRRPLIAMTLLGGLASTAFIPLSAWLIGQLGWRSSCMVLGALHLLICLPIHAVFLRGEPLPRPALKQGADGNMARETSLRALSTSATFLLVSGCVIGLSLLSAALSAHMVPLLSERGLPMAWAIAIPASIGVMQVLGRLVLLALEGRLDPQRLDRTIPLLLPASLLILLAGNGSIGAALAFALCFGVGNGLITIVKATAIASYVSRERVAALTGLQNLPVAVARAVGPVMMGSLWSLQGRYTLAIWVLIGLGVMSALMLRAAQQRALQVDTPERNAA